MPDHVAAANDADEHALADNRHFLDLLVSERRCNSLHLVVPLRSLDFFFAIVMTFRFNKCFARSSNSSLSPLTTAK